MKLLYFDDFKLGVLKGENQVVDVTAVVQDIPHTNPGNLMNGLIERFGQYRSKLQQAAGQGSGVPVSSVRIRPPVPAPINIDCMAVNYMENGTLPAKPPINAFHKSPSAIIGNGDTMVLPDVPATIFEGEAELAVVMGKTATRVPAAQWKDYVFGYMGFIDGSARGLPPAGNTFFQMKSRETFCPLGPYLVTADEVPDVYNLTVKLWNNGVLMQDYHTSDMAHKLDECIEWATSIHTLYPGDIIAAGTNHRGLNPFMDGDKIELEIQGMGRLTFNIRDDLKRTWGRITRLQAREAKAATSLGHTPQVSGKYAEQTSKV